MASRAWELLICSGSGRPALDVIPAVSGYDGAALRDACHGGDLAQADRGP